MRDIDRKGWWSLVTATRIRNYAFFFMAIRLDVPLIQETRYITKFLYLHLMSIVKPSCNNSDALFGAGDAADELQPLELR